jgi:hypothetical protein
MASAAFENVRAVRTVRAAIWAKRAVAQGGVLQGERARSSGRSSSVAAGLRRGFGASLLIASGYVAFVTAIRWLLLHA